MHIWNNFISQLEKQMGVVTITKWLRPLKIIKFDACNIYLEAENSFQISWFEEYIRPKIKDNLKNNNGHKIKVHLALKGSFNEKKEFVQKKTPISEPFEIKSEILKPDFSFSSYYCDEKNKLTYEFLKNITLSPEKKEEIELGTFNPIFIYGPSGCGKSHLLSATAQKLQKSGLNVFYLNAQTFTDHVVKAFRLSSLPHFRNTYRNLDVLIVDDIHIIANRNATQEEFFHTFNTLHTRSCQIILSSNVHPNQLQGIEQRLTSRFSWGISLPLYPVEENGLKLILDNKCQNFSIYLDDEAQKFILNKFDSSKEIEKAIHALLLRAENLSEKINLYQAKSYLTDLIAQKEEKKLSPISIIDSIATHFGITSDDILGKSQKKEYSVPRQISMYFCREKLHIPYKKIGSIFSRDHSTVMANIKQIQQKKEKKEKDIYYNLLDIEKKI